MCLLLHFVQCAVVHLCIIIIETWTKCFNCIVGKTHTILGTEEAPGFIPHAIKHLFVRVRQLIVPSKVSIALSMAYIEIYQEKVCTYLVWVCLYFIVKIAKGIYMYCCFLLSQRRFLTGYEFSAKTLQLLLDKFTYTGMRFLQTNFA